MSICKLNAALLGFVLTAVGAAGAETGDAPYAYSVSDTYAPPAQAKSADAEKMRERTSTNRRASVFRVVGNKSPQTPPRLFFVRGHVGLGRLSRALGGRHHLRQEVRGQPRFLNARAW